MARRLFLERRTYRQNRLQDAARLLPFLGAILIFGPIFIRDDGAGAPTLATTLVYFFAVWLGMIALTALVSRALIRSTPGEGEEGRKAAPPRKVTAEEEP
ncbi:hypothetical protein [Gymnodinialimonas sp.]